MRSAIADIEALEPRHWRGRARSVGGLVIEASGPSGAFPLGARALTGAREGDLECEVVGVRDGKALLMAYGSLEGARAGADVRLAEASPSVRPNAAWLGRVVDAFGRPADGKGSLDEGDLPVRLRATPPRACERARLGERMTTGVRALDTFAQVRRGQRLGIFAGSGVGKSVLMSMLARRAESQVAVIGLIGERGREAREFVEDVLGEEGLARSVVVLATSDESALARRQAAWTTLAVAEYFRDQGQDVLCLMDSVTRFAMAQREIGLAAGEPPTTRGYTPSVFAELPRLLERAGPGYDNGGKTGTITGLFSVLVEGDDMNEPVADAVRGVLDGHVVMSRDIAERGRFPAIDVLKTVSRAMPDCQTPEEQQITRQARRMLSSYADMEELIRIGAYQRGSDPELDQAIALNPELEAFLAQDKNEATSMEESFARLQGILSGRGMNQEDNNE
ncbi:MAG: flagellar protein export ATPase FliI [Euryhalocaulis sp.]|uniref:flagellar protein export ATPase FliI n=1 Tax=Euryhalocaulis sp. TaxID=2744307 RepID=UPI0018281D0C|nr:flagellar protein export ATPase FliI [Euryhalocaulis sp.]MBA4801446.1 flagellar protein export ATPase FliI [Euryhalocaulis sp.]